MNFKKIDKEFCITDNSVNCYGYRLLTEGFLIGSFNPPIGYLMHNRDKGVAVRWSDFRIDGNSVFAKPTVNASQFPDLADEIISGFYDAASVGHIIALEWTDDPKMKLPGQTGITVTKWFCRECSIVDIPGNFNAIAELYDKDDKSLRDLVSKPATAAVRDVEAVPEKYRKKITELFLSNDLEHVKKNYPKYYAKIVKDKEGKGDHYRPLPGYGIKTPGTSGLQANGKEAPVPEKYAGKSYTELWLSGDLEPLKKTYPLYAKQLQDKGLWALEQANNRGLSGNAVRRTSCNLSIPERFRNKTLQELFCNGGMAYLKAYHPEEFNNLISNN